MIPATENTSDRRGRPPGPTPGPAPILIGTIIVTVIAVVAALAAMSINRTPVASAGSENLRQLWPFWIASGAAWAALTGLWWWLRRHPAASTAPGAFRRAALLVFGVAIAARGGVLIWHDVGLSDDIHRYVFDGRNMAAGVNPYLVTAEERLAALALAPDSEAWPGEASMAAPMNNRELPTIYLPASQWTFRSIGSIAAMTGAGPVTSARIFRFVFVLIEMATIGLVLAALAQRGRSPWWIALYAWHPLPIAEIAGSGHQDVIGVAGLLVALMTIGRITPARLSLTLGAMCSLATWLASAAIGAATCLALAAPLLLVDGGSPLDALRGTAARFSLKWAHFGSVYEPMLTAIERVTPTWTNDPQEQVARLVCVGLLALVVVVVWWRGRDAWRDSALIFLAMVLLSPTAHPWYLLWALTLLPMAPLPSVWVASLTLPWGYAVLGDTVDWKIAPWVFVVAYLPVYLALVAECMYRRRAEPLSGEDPA